MFLRQCGTKLGNIKPGCYQLGFVLLKNGQYGGAVPQH